MAGVPGPHRSSQEWAVDIGVGQHRPPQDRDGFRVLLTTQASHNHVIQRQREVDCWLHLSCGTEEDSFCENTRP